MSINIAIDGPAGAGKSTIAKIIAKNLGFIYVDTGAMYRAVALYLLKNSVPAENTELIADRCTGADVTIRYADGEQRVILNGEDVTGSLRQEAVGNMASAAAVVPAVRSRLTQLQRELAAKNDVVMDGRDIGTTVLPDAEVKVYLTASSRVRAQRRFDELAAKGESADLDTIERDIIERDERDMHREISPLKKADDAVLIDSSYMSIEEVAQKIIELVKK